MSFIDRVHHAFELPLTNPVLIFSLILFIILLAPILLRKIKVPGIIGLILSGVIIGPYGLNLLEQNSAVTLFSTIGLLYIMFIAGIELDMFDFKKNKYKSIGFGFFTFIFPLLLGVPVLYYLLGYDFNASLLTASMFATHTLVSYPITSKFGISKNQAVAITVGGTILTDTAVLILLAVIIGSVEGGLTSEFWIELLISLTIFASLVFLVVPRVAKWFFRNLEGEHTLQYVLILSLVFLSAFLAELAGVEPIIGAFVSGLALNRLIPHSSALMNRLEFVGNAIFIPFFLISVGMLVDVSILLKGPDAIIIALSLSVVALTGKWIASRITQWSFGYTKSQGNLIFGLSSAHAAATLAVILVGYRADIIDENILNGTVILILITSVAASFITENASKKIVQEQEKPGEQEDTSSGAENILVPIANFDNLELLLDLATLIKSKAGRTSIHILSVLKYDEKSESSMLKMKQKMEHYVRYASATETYVNPVVTLDLSPADGIIRISHEVLADIILMGWPRKGTFRDKIFGETSKHIVSSTHKTIFFSNLSTPLSNTGMINLLCPPAAELEPGFHQWLNKIIILATELSAGIRLFGEEHTYKAIETYVDKNKLVSNFSFEEFTDLEDFLILARDIKDDDLFAVVSAREDAVSFNSALKNVHEKLKKHFQNNNLLLIYPSIHNDDQRFKEYEDLGSL
ncbi:MAG: cation:proton antiporter [Cyclobacteriaceae bacterium]